MLPRFPQSLLGPFCVLALAVVFERSQLLWGPTLATPLLLIVVITVSFRTGAFSSFLSAFVAWVDVSFLIPSHLHARLSHAELVGRDVLWFCILFGTAATIGRMKRRLRRELDEKLHESERARETLLESELRSRGLIEFAFDAFVGMNAHGEITDWNLQAESTFGWSRREIIGRTLSEVLMPARYRRDFNEGMAHFLEAGQSATLNRRVELFALHRDGREIPVEITVYPIRLAHGLAFGSFLHDITERRTNERRLMDLNENLECLVEDRTRELREAFDRVEEASRCKDEFLALVSHELRNPLGAILGASDLLAKGLGLSDPRLHLAEIIHRNAANQNRLINDLLDVSRVITGKLEVERSAVDLNSLVHTVVESSRLSARQKRIALSCRLPENPTELYGDAARLQQVLWNLLSNALKFTREGGKVEVELSANSSAAIFRVRDNGRGINPEFLPYVFESFRQEDARTTRQFGGLGLGLSIVKHIVESHAGTCHAQSEGLGCGTEIKITLPRLPLPALRSEAPRPLRAGSRASLADVDVLVVDDSEDGLYILRLHLEKAGAHVRTALSAEEARAHFEERVPDLLLSDISMPGEDGYSFIRSIRRLSGPRGGKVPAIALTAHAREEEMRRALHNGFDLHVAKPVNVENLLNQAQMLLERWPNHCTLLSPDLP